MPTEGFFHRWSRLKTEPAPPAPVPDELAVSPAPPPAAPAGQDGQVEGAPLRQPSLEDVAQLRADSDYSAFVARGVDKSVQRSALKKLFADPHFNMGDGLDLYMGDYNKPDPIPAAMMSALRHTQSFFAQAYPDKETGIEDATAVHDEPPIHDNLTNPEPQMADTTGAASAASEDDT
ncbi:DUF3306 domain-containing protein [Massilia sp. RP-1-19]|uniref:DUF3306 domain-containing protein n=1 Tax=Massilia polaris TaxID=2728846 RepID=A0A848HSP9_9BURK|nr:DUF3306 domain-containing protein [Massilia polaris]NML62761.1 DUF3306 domain-containing protein [Massilia polaris]